jgi:endonuclease/exonuclease/phosphatase family metal-dependent hydrolase
MTAKFKMPWGKIFFWVELGTWALLCLALVLRLTVKDSFTPLAYVFYGTPLLVLTLLALFLVVFCFFKGQRERVSVALFIMVFCFVNFYRAAWKDNEPRAEASIKVLNWNVLRGRRTWKLVFKEIRSKKADLMGFVEAGWADSEARSLWPKHFKDYYQTELEGGLIILSKHKIVEVLSKDGDEDLRHLAVAIEIDSVIHHLILIDLLHSPRNSREGAFNKIAALIDKFGDRPLILMGDLNTPPDSVYMNKLRNRNMKEVFEEAGQGWHISWSTLIPILAIDQMWINDKLKAHTARLDWTTISDHFPLTATIQTVD